MQALAYEPSQANVWINLFRAFLHGDWIGIVVLQPVEDGTVLVRVSLAGDGGVTHKSCSDWTDHCAWQALLVLGVDSRGFVELEHPPRRKPTFRNFLA